jgi:hypothetical protein
MDIQMTIEVIEVDPKERYRGEFSVVFPGETRGDFLFTLLNPLNQDVILTLTSKSTQQMIVMQGITTQGDLAGFSPGNQLLLWMVQGAMIDALERLIPEEADTDTRLWRQTQREFVVEILGGEVKTSVTLRIVFSVQDVERIEGLIRELRTKQAA